MKRFSFVVEMNSKKKETFIYCLNFLKLFLVSLAAYQKIDKPLKTVINKLINNKRQTAQNKTKQKNKQSQTQNKTKLDFIMMRHFIIKNQ